MILEDDCTLKKGAVEMRLNERDSDDGEEIRNRERNSLKGLVD